jgi:phage terminase small subunit
MAEVKPDRTEAKAKALETLRALNPNTPQATLVMYVDALLDYREAQANIDQNGALVAHPRTGTPMDNPYLKIRDRAGATLRGIRVKADELWS